MSSSRLRRAGQRVVAENRVKRLARALHSEVRVLWEPEHMRAAPRVIDGAPAASHGQSALYDAEYAALRVVQKAVPALTPLALAVHYAVKEELVTPLAALAVWLLSLRASCSVIIFACASLLGNAAIKWAVQRPRPAWTGYPGGGVLNVRGAWEKDLSFPSGHTQFFSGLAVCAALSYEQLGAAWLRTAVALGALSGLTRNYLGVHFVSDTLVGWGLGCALAALWVHHDPFGALLRAASLRTSLAVASGATALAVAALLGVRALVSPVPDAAVRDWFLHAAATLPPAVRAAVLSPDAAAELRAKYMRPLRPVPVPTLRELCANPAPTRRVLDGARCTDPPL